MKKESITRRGFLGLAQIGGVSLLLSACSPKKLQLPLPTPAGSTEGESPDIELSLSAIPDRVQILPGNKTTVWRYQGEVLSGPSSALQEIPDSYLGPIIHVNKGQRIRIHFNNQLPEPSIVHWHGLHVPPAADGHPRLVIDPGETYQYDFTVMDRAGTYWYHPHPHGRTGGQVYAGLAGLFIIHDQDEDLIDLPAGEYDIPLVIQDRIFDSENQLVYGSRGMMDQMMGFLGDQILINGQPDFNLQVKSQPYRLRLLNGSNSRIYKLAWDDGSPLVVIGTDGGLLEKPVEKEFITLAPAQRIEIWEDFGQEGSGSSKNLINLPFDGYGGQVTYSVAKVTVAKSDSSGTLLPENLSVHETHEIKDAVNHLSPRSFELAIASGMVWTLNGRTFEMEEVAPNEIVKLNDLEVWEFENLPGGGMGMMGGMSLPHPIHLHALQFQVIERIISSSTQEGWNTLSAGFVDEGWHDTVLVYPGEKVKILVKFEDFTGLYLYHCHNLEHEDMGMMRNYLVEA
jgi:FtsP/CotA-like multicopper oxidase with cupredoxin domain